jgi:hypothetical protein
MLLPGMVEYVAKVAGMTADEAVVQSHLPAMAEIIKAFGTLFTNIAEDLRESSRLSFWNYFLMWPRGRRRSHIGGPASNIDATTRPESDHTIASSYASPQPTFNIRLVITCRFQRGHWQTRSSDERAFRKCRPERTK